MTSRSTVHQMPRCDMANPGLLVHEDSHLDVVVVDSGVRYPVLEQHIDDVVISVDAHVLCCNGTAPALGMLIALGAVGYHIGVVHCGIECIVLELAGKAHGWVCLVAYEVSRMDQHMQEHSLPILHPTRTFPVTAALISAVRYSCKRSIAASTLVASASKSAVLVVI